MAPLWTDCVDTDTVDRLVFAGAGALHLSDGTLVCLNWDDNTATLFLRYSSDHSTINAIDSISIGAVGSFRAGNFFLAAALCRDSLDNLYVVGQDHDNGGVPFYRVFAYTKGTGYSWTRTTLTGAGPTGNTNFSAHAVRWCNTGGGTNSKGHLMVVSVAATAGGNYNSYAIMDAGAALAGAGTLVVNTAASPTFFGTATAASATGIDLDNDGFGATSGVAVAVFSSGNYTAGHWAVSSLGALSTNANITTTLSGSSFRIRLIRVSSNLWIFGCLSTHWGIARLSSTAVLTATTDSGAPTGHPSFLDVFGIDFALDPSTAGLVWAYGTNSSTDSSVKRLSCDVTSGVSWSSTIINDGTMGSAISSLSLRCVPTPIATVIDFQVNTTSGSNHEIAGNYSDFTPTPGTRMPWLVPPQQTMVRAAVR